MTEIDFYLPPPLTFGKSFHYQNLNLKVDPPVSESLKQLCEKIASRAETELLPDGLLIPDLNLLPYLLASAYTSAGFEMRLFGTGNTVTDIMLIYLSEVPFPEKSPLTPHSLSEFGQLFI